MRIFSIFKNLSQALIMATVLSACSDSSNEQFPKVTLSQDQILKYNASCKACHENASTAAPVKGDSARWSDIFSNSIEIVMQRVINGYNGMPPLGQCFDCSEEELKLFVQYLAQPLGSANKNN